MKPASNPRWHRPAAVAAAACLLACGCVSVPLPMQMAASTTPVHPPAYSIVGPASGEACQKQLFHFFDLGREDNRLRSAIDASLAGKDADALINVTSHLTITNYFNLVQKYCTRVEGVAVKLK